MRLRLILAAAGWLWGGAALARPGSLPDSLLVRPDEPAVRPFITDDARVVGQRLAQAEAWFRLDRESGQQWILGAYGPNPRLELTAGGVFGYFRPEGESSTFSYALPLLQAKYLLRPYGPGRGPGYGLVAGTFLPGGTGEFKPRGYGTFGYLTVSQCFGEREDVLIHANLGYNFQHIDRSNVWQGTLGLGTQVRTWGGFHLVGEIFSGDPYVPGSGFSYQVGFRHFFSDLVQIDMTLGQGLAGQNPLPLWGSVGVRLVTERFARSRRR